MLLRDRIGLTMTPLLLRVGLGVVFLWAGSSKLFVTTTFEGEAARTLAAIGVGANPSGAAPAADALHGADAEGEGAELEDAPSGEGAEVESAGDAATIGDEAPIEPAGFAGEIRARRLYSVAVQLHTSAHPESGARLWPAELASPRWCRVLAWSAALTEFLGGALVLVGFLTRLWGLALAGVMAVAMLLSTIGPAFIGSDSFLWFLPAHRFGEPGGAWVAAWTPWLFQFVLLMSALGVFFSGAGRVSLDGLIFPRTDGGTKPRGSVAEEEESEGSRRGRGRPL